MSLLRVVKAKKNYDHNLWKLNGDILYRMYFKIRVLKENVLFLLSKIIKQFLDICAKTHANLKAFLPCSDEILSVSVSMKMLTSS